MAGRTTFNGQPLMLRDSHLASNIYGLGQGTLTTIPKPKFLFFVKFYQRSSTNNAISGIVQTATGISITNNSMVSSSLEELGFVAKSVDKPKVKFQTEVLNQYNKKRVIQTKHDFQPISMKFHDTTDNRIFQMFQNYYKFYYGADAWSTQVMSWRNDVVAQNFVYGAGLGTNTPWGYYPPVDSTFNPTNSYFFDRIEIYQIFNGMYDIFTLVNPKIESFDPDEMNYEDGKGTCEISMTVQYEGMILNVTNQPISASDMVEMGFNLSDQFDVNAAPIPTSPPAPISTTSTSSTLTQPNNTTSTTTPTTTATTVSTASFSGQFNGNNNTGTVSPTVDNSWNPYSRGVAALVGAGST